VAALARARRGGARGEQLPASRRTAAFPTCPRRVVVAFFALRRPRSGHDLGDAGEGREHDPRLLPNHPDDVDWNPVWTPDQSAIYFNARPGPDYGLAAPPACRPREASPPALRQRGRMTDPKISRTAGASPSGGSPRERALRPRGDVSSPRRAATHREGLGTRSAATIPGRPAPSLGSPERPAAKPTSSRSTSPPASAAGSPHYGRFPPGRDRVCGVSPDGTRIGVTPLGAGLRRGTRLRHDPRRGTALEPQLAWAKAAVGRGRRARSPFISRTRCPPGARESGSPISPIISG